MFPHKQHLLVYLVIAFLSITNLYNSPLALAKNKANSKTTLIKSNIEIADSGKVIFQFFDEVDGIPQNTINTVAVDKKGYIWVGTQDGAAYYNGHSWTTVNMPNRTLSNWVYQIYVSKDGRVWFCTNGGGLSAYKDGIWTTYDIRSGLPNDQVRSFLETTSSNGKEILWVGTSNGLARFEDNKWTTYNTSNSKLPNNLIRHLLKTTNSSGSQAIWVGTDLGLACFENNEWVIYNTSNSKLPNNVIRGLAKSQSKSDHSLWIATEGGIAHFDNYTWTIYQDKDGLASNEVRCILETMNSKGKKILWVGTGGFGLSRFEIENSKWTTYTTKSGLADDSVWSLLETTSVAGIKTLWIGMASRGGLAKLETGKWVSFNTDSGLPNNAVFSIMESKKDDGSSSFWIGTDGGLGYWENGLWTIYNLKSGLPNNTVRAFLETKENDGRKITWIATEGGLIKIDRGKWQIIDTKSGLPSNRIYCLLSTKNKKGENILWVGTREGLAYCENGLWQSYNISNSKLPNNTIRSLLATYDKAGQEIIWIGTESGLSALKANEWTQNLSQHRIRALLKTEYQDKEWLWVGTDSGVFWTEIDISNWQWLSDTTSPAIPNNTIYQIRADKENRIYLSTNKGLVRLTKINPNLNDTNYSIYNFTIKDGLPNNECNSGASLVDSLGRIWVGTIGGAALFDPSKETLDNSPKPFYLEKLLVDGKPQKFDNPTTNLDKLSFDQNNITFEYALLSYFRESDSRYRFQLVGYDKTLSDWTNEPKKEYQNLSSGEYTFNVWAKDYLGNISGPLSVKFYIKAAPWLSWWAYSLYLIVLGSIIYLLHNYRLERLSKQNILLEAKVNERTDQLAQTNKELFTALEQIRISQKQTEEKNQELAIKNLEFDQKNAELASKNLELIELHKRADRIFSALAQALPGTILDEKYKLEEKIGSGGFGAVYRATHLSLKKPVAIKIFRPVPGNDSIEALERFQLEAVSSCRINHLNSVAVLDSGISDDGIAYLVMELLKGQTLKNEILGKRRLSLKRSIEILLPVCDVLEKAHQAGVVHRDIKPDNIFLHEDEKGEIVKVVDFGIAKIIDMIDVSGNLTNTGGLIGTPAYMAPERLTNQPYDGRSDIYSLGVMFYQMLSGHLPFSSPDNNLSSIILKHLIEDPIPLEKFNLKVPKLIEETILKMLEKDQNNRPTSKDVAEVLKSVLENDLSDYNNPLSLSNSIDDDIPTVSRSINSLEKVISSPTQTNNITITGESKVTTNLTEIV
ncbi:MAG: protein kinase [Acidobacteria bacterium]|nr:protein kinase [Acidobacteriota bacterium]